MLHQTFTAIGRRIKRHVESGLAHASNNPAQMTTSTLIQSGGAKHPGDICAEYYVATLKLGKAGLVYSVSHIQKDLVSGVQTSEPVGTYEPAQAWKTMNSFEMELTHASEDPDALPRRLESKSRANILCPNIMPARERAEKAWHALVQ